MEDLYIRVGWPEYQEYQQYDGFDEHNFYDAVNNQCFIERKWAHSCRLEKGIVEGKGDFGLAIDYVKNRLGGLENVVCAQILLRDEPDMTIDDIDSALASMIYDLMEEYGEDNDLPEGWWLEYGEVQDVLMKL